MKPEEKFKLTSTIAYAAFLLLLRLSHANCQSSEPSVSVVLPSGESEHEPSSPASATPPVNTDDGDPCGCQAVEIVSTREDVLKKHSSLLGRYRRRDTLVNGRHSYEHFSGTFFLYYNTHSQGFWAVSEQLNTDVVRLENQADSDCPYKMKALWRFADGDLNALVYDISLQVVCLDDPCSVANCGQRALCVQTSNSTGNLTQNTICQCEEGFFGNPYERCYPAHEHFANADNCGCQRLIFSTQNSVALSKHHNSYGEYFLYGEYNGSPVYQHFAGVEYLYQRDGNWLISDQIGLREAGLQNQGDVANCPYRFRTTWEYADIEQPGWQWVYDYTARLVCPTDKCSVTKCGFHASCREVRGQGTCSCDQGYHGNPYIRCFPIEEEEDTLDGCGCKELILSSLGASALAQADKMGSYYFYAWHGGRRAYQHKSGLDYLFFAEGNAWVIGAKFGGSRVGIVNFDRGTCAYNLTSYWRHSVGGRLQTDESLTLQCNDFNYEFSPRDPLDPSNPTQTTTSATPLPTAQTQTEATTKSTLFPVTSTSTLRIPTTTAPHLVTSTVSSTTVRTVPIQTILPIDLKSANNGSLETVTFQTRPTLSDLSTSTTARSTTTTSTTTTTTTEPPLDTECTCPEIIINSTHRPTVLKHGSQLGVYVLHEAKSGRPVYKHKLREQYLYYHPYSGGNWLINSEVGLLYGGIQNSKDYPVCPYLINTVWQYGDSELGGWVYDPSLSVTCPTNKCSILKCGFRAQCIENEGEEPRCECRPGFDGDPRVRCYPSEIQPSCPCLKLALSSSGPSRDHQRDKMGEYYLWGYYNNKPVYQHSSGLDFLYFHKNNVWGIGPKIGGNSAGLLNFGTKQCPYALTSAWEFGTKDKTFRRQVDKTIRLACADPAPQVHQYQNQPPNPYGAPQPPHRPLQPLQRQPYTAQQQVKQQQIQQNNGQIDRHYESQTSQVHPRPYIPQPPVSSGVPKLPSPALNPFQRRPHVNPESLSAKCGLRTIMPDAARLLSPSGNKTAKYGAFPWHAQVSVVSPGQKDIHLCSAIIVSEKYVLTVASCMNSEPLRKLRIVVGQHGVNLNDEYEESRSIQSIYIHDEYDDITGANDIALVKLRQPLIFSDYIRPVCLPATPDTVVPKPTLCEITSWRASARGQAEQGHLQGSAVPIVQDPCTQEPREAEQYDERTRICSGSFRNSMDCDLDRGTPLVCSIRDRATITGLLAHPPTCHEESTERSTTLVRVAQYTQWIQKRLEL